MIYTTKYCLLLFFFLLISKVYGQNALANAFGKLGRSEWRAAEKEFTKAIKEGPSLTIEDKDCWYSMAYGARARCLMEQGKIDAALKDLQAAEMYTCSDPSITSANSRDKQKCIDAQSIKGFDHLKKYVGEYSSEKVLMDKKVNPILKKMMGKEYKHLINNLSVTGPVDLIAGSIVISGNAPHSGGYDMGILDINLYTGKIHAAIYLAGIITIFSSEDTKKYEYLPISIKDWIAVVNRSLKDRSEKPQNVIFN